MCQLPNWHNGPVVRRCCPYNKKVIKGTEPVTSSISFRSEEEHKAALYDACLLIVNTYNQTEMLEDYGYRGLTSYDFMTFARHIVNEIAEG